MNANDFATETLFQQEIGTNISNPALVFEKAMQEVAEIYALLKSEYDTRFEDLDSYLQQSEPELVDRLNQLWNKVDCDIYDRFKTAQLSNRDYYEWKNHLNEWKKKFVSAVRLYIYKNCGRIFQIPMKTMPIAA